tara:strand:- start:68 stop:346 length:279 start_codon:yes stop_codon:yes gene_type:complete
VFLNRRKSVFETTKKIHKSESQGVFPVDALKIIIKTICYGNSTFASNANGRLAAVDIGGVTQTVIGLLQSFDFVRADWPGLRRGFRLPWCWT